MNLLLISDTAIIHHIFSLVCSKLNLELKIQKIGNIEGEFDFIVVDQNYIDDKFNDKKRFSKKLGAISSEELSFDKARDFIIPRPFLPTKLEEILKEQIGVLQFDKNFIDDKNSEQLNLDEDFAIEDEEVTIPITEYVESLADEIYDNINEENDESIVSPVFINQGGVLDVSELSKINEILQEEANEDVVNLERSDWKDISDIIDDALEEVREYEFDLDDTVAKKYKLILSNYKIDELKPLLNRCNQEIVDKLSSGQSVDIRLMLKDDK